MRKLKLLALLGLAFAMSPASATIWQIGDDDGYGIGICNGCNHPFNGFTAGFDGRSPAEVAATDGAQYTDTYSVTHGSFSPADQTGSVATFSFLGLPSGWTAGHIQFDAADFQASTFGAVVTQFNGVTQPFNFNDGFPSTAIHHFALDAAVLASINSTNQLVITIDRNNSGDFYGFDYVRLNDFPAPTPEPEAMALLMMGLGLLGVVARRRKQRV